METHFPNCKELGNITGIDPTVIAPDSSHLNVSNEVIDDTKQQEFVSNWNIIHTYGWKQLLPYTKLLEDQTHFL